MRYISLVYYTFLTLLLGAPQVYSCPDLFVPQSLRQTIHATLFFSANELRWIKDKTEDPDTIDNYPNEYQTEPENSHAALLVNRPFTAIGKIRLNRRGEVTVRDLLRNQYPGNPKEMKHSEHDLELAENLFRRFIDHARKANPEMNLRLKQKTSFSAIFTIIRYEIKMGEIVSGLRQHKDNGIWQGFVIATLPEGLKTGRSTFGPKENTEAILVPTNHFISFDSNLLHGFESLDMREHTESDVFIRTAVSFIIRE